MTRYEERQQQRCTEAFAGGRRRRRTGGERRRRRMQRKIGNRPTKNWRILAEGDFDVAQRLVQYGGGTDVRQRR